MGASLRSLWIFANLGAVGPCPIHAMVMLSFLRDTGARLKKRPVGRGGNSEQDKNRQAEINSRSGIDNA